MKTPQDHSNTHPRPPKTPKKWNVGCACGYPPHPSKSPPRPPKGIPHPHSSSSFLYSFLYSFLFILFIPLHSSSLLFTPLHSSSFFFPPLSSVLPFPFDCFAFSFGQAGRQGLIVGHSLLYHTAILQQDELASGRHFCLARQWRWFRQNALAHACRQVAPFSLIPRHPKSSRHPRRSLFTSTTTVNTRGTATNSG